MLKSWERISLLCALLVIPLLAFLDFSLLHPGVCEIDESASLRSAWNFAAGRGWNPAFFTGSWQRLAMGFSLRLFPRLDWALQLPSLAAFILELFLLARLSTALFGARVAAGALLFNLLCAFSLARSRAAISYAVLPCDMLLVLNLALHSRQAPWRTALAGLACGLFFLDYEAWPAAFASLALVLLLLQKRLDFKWAPLLWGSLLGLGIALALSAYLLPYYVEQRRHFIFASSSALDLGWGANLLHFFTGGRVLPSMGVASHPALAPWALPFLAWGSLIALKRQPWLLGWAALGLLPLLLPTAGLTEANRGIAAWPALAILVGLGLASLPEKKWLQIALALWLACGAALEAAAFFRSQELLAPENYALSNAELHAGHWLAEENAKEPLRLLSQLGYQRAEELEWASGGLQASHAGRIVALVPWDAIPIFGTSAGTLHAFSDSRGKRRILLLEPNAQWKSRLIQFDEELGRRNAQLDAWDRSGNSVKLRAWLESEKNLDPWLRTVLWQKLMTELSVLGKVDDALVDDLLKEPLAHAGPLNYPAYYLARLRPDLAAKLRARALQLDSRLRN